MGNAEHGVVDQHLDVLAEARRVESQSAASSSGKAGRAPVQDLAQGLTGREGLLKITLPVPSPPASLVTQVVTSMVTVRTWEAVLDRSRSASRLFHSSLLSASSPSFSRVSGLGLPVFRSYPTVSYQTSSIRSHCAMTLWSLAGPSTGWEP